MTTAVSKVTPQSAPRDAEGLEKLGIFQLRLLIEQCGGLADDQSKMAFARMKPEEKIHLALQLLAAFDARNGGAPMNGMNGMGAPPTMAPMPGMMPQQPMMQMPGMPVMQVDPAAVAAAAAAAAPPPPATRSPRTSSSKAASAPAPDLGVDIVNALNRIMAQNEESNNVLSAGFKDLSASVAEVAKANHQHSENYKAVYGALQQMNQQLAFNGMMTKLAMALVLPLAEQTLGATREDILRITLGDVDAITAFIQQATTPGKG